MEDLTPEVRKTLELMQTELEAKQSVSDEQMLQDYEAKQGVGTSLQAIFGEGAEPVDRAMDAIGAGALKAGFETYDFLFGEPEEADKTDTRRSVEAHDRALKRKSVGYGLASGVTQMVVGLIGAGKLMAPINVVKNAGNVGRTAFEIGRGGVASTVVLDPHEERLSNLIEAFPDLQNPVSDYLAADLTDTTAEGRFKNALESIGLDFALLGALKAMKYLRAGDTESAAKEIVKLEKSRAEFSQDFGGGAQAGVEKDLTVGAGPTQANKDAFGLDFPGKQADDVAAASPGAPVESASPAPAREAAQEAQRLQFRTEAIDIFTRRGSEDLTPREQRIYDAIPPEMRDAVEKFFSEEASLRSAEDLLDDDIVQGLREESRRRMDELRPTIARFYDRLNEIYSGGVGTTASPTDVVREQIGQKPPAIDPKTGEPILPTQKAAPDTVRTQDIPDEDLAKILKESQADAAAIKKYGSKADAKLAGHRFARNTRLPWQKLRTTAESRSLMERTASTLRSRFDKIKGGAVLKDARVRLLVDDIAELYGHDPAHVMGQLAEAGSDASRMVANMEASLLIGNRMLSDVDDLAARIRVGNVPEYGGDVVRAMDDLKGQLAVALDTISAGNSVLANSGRALRRARGQFRIRPKDLAALSKMDPEKVIIIMEKAKGNPRELARMVSSTWRTRVMDEAIFHLTNGLLWMWPTHVVNTTTNALMMAARPTEKLFGSAALRLVTKDPGKIAELSSVSRQALKEYSYTVASLADGWHNAVEAFRRGDSILNPHHTEFFDVGVPTQELPWRPVQGVADIAHNAWMSASYRNLTGLPTRLLGAADEFFKTSRYRAVVQARAAVDAADRGLTGIDAKRYIQKAMDEAIDGDTGRATDTAAMREAQMVSFQQDLNYDTTIGGAFGKSLQSARKSAPALAIVLPFVKTPVNVIRYGIKLTPGLNLAQKEFRDAFRGVNGAEAQAHAYGQMSLASMFGGLAAHLALSGRITGSGPDDYKLKQELLATGWKPYSVVGEAEDGSRTYYQLGRFDPVAMPFSLVADIVENIQKNPDADYSAQMTAVAVAMAKNLGEKTFLLNLNSAMEAFLNPDDGRLARWVGRTAGNMLPASSLIRGHNPDPYLREARTFVDAAMRGAPGASETLPFTMDVFGDPIERHVGLWDTQDGGDIVVAEHNRIMLQTDKGIGKPDPKFEGVDLRDITLESGVNAYQRLQELSGHPTGMPSLKDSLEKLIRSDEYQSLPDGDASLKGTRLNALGRIVGKYREAGKKLLLKESKMLRDLVGSRQREVAAAYQANKRGLSQEPGGVELLEALRNEQ